MKKLGLLCLVLSAMVILTSCNKKKKTMRTDTPTSGEAFLAVDDCFKPIIQQEIEVFESLHENAILVPIYDNEVGVINALLRDSVRLAITARELTRGEEQTIRNKKLTPRTQRVAVDGVALIINKENNDSLISVSALKKIMTGEIKSWKEINPASKYDNITVVFDNQNSSTVRFIKDSINRGAPLAESLRAQDDNSAVLDYVSRTPYAMGVIGVSWVSNPADTTNLSFTDKVTVMGVSRSDNATIDNSYKPFAAYLALGEYPLIRDIYVIVTDLRETLPTGFMSFLISDVGQKIILKSGILPARRTFRIVSVKDSF